MSDSGAITVSYKQVNDDILKTLEAPRLGWYLLILTALSGLLVGALSWKNQILYGIGMSGCVVSQN